MPKKNVPPPKEPKKHETFKLNLTKFELLHLRDLFSIGLPPELKQTVSQALAAAEERNMVEARLWQKVVNACKSAELPMDDDAPDFICAASAPPPVGVFRLAHEQNQGQVTADTGSSPFGITEDDDGKESP